MNLELTREQRDGYYGVRLTYKGFQSHQVQTSAHRSTRANLEACIAALAALEGVTPENMRLILERDAENVTVDTYRSYGRAV